MTSLFLSLTNCKMKQWLRWKDLMLYCISFLIPPFTQTTICLISIKGIPMRTFSSFILFQHLHNNTYESQCSLHCSPATLSPFFSLYFHHESTRKYSLNAVSQINSYQRPVLFLWLFLFRFQLSAFEAFYEKHRLTLKFNISKLILTQVILNSVHISTKVNMFQAHSLLFQAIMSFTRQYNHEFTKLYRFCSPLKHSC